MNAGDEPSPVAEPVVLLRVLSQSSTIRCPGEPLFLPLLRLVAGKAGVT